MIYADHDLYRRALCTSTPTFKLIGVPIDVFEWRFCSSRLDST